MRKEIEINGCIEIPSEMTIDEFTDIFINFIESKSWYFGGGFQEIIDGCYVLSDETKDKSAGEKRNL